MSLLGNIVWIIFGGLFIAIEYFIAGLAMCITIIGIPFGLQLFKIGALALMPFGKNSSVISDRSTGCLYLVLNVLWILTGGLAIALSHLFWGVLFSITVVGLPFGIQHFKLMSLAFTPFGRDIK